MELIAEELQPTELGSLPLDWQVKRIGEEIDLLTGFPFPSSKYAKAGIRLLRGSNVKRNQTDWSLELTQYWEKLTPDLQKFLLKEGDIVIAMDGSLVGRSFAVLAKKDVPALLLQRVARVRSNKIYLPYLKEFICSDYFTRHCDKVKTSSAIPHISPNDIRNFSIPIPPTIEEQTAIATALSDTDALISSLEKLIAKKGNIKQGAMQQLLKPKEGWEVRKLGEIAEVKTGNTPPTKDFSNYGSEYFFVSPFDLGKSKYILNTDKKLSAKGFSISRIFPKHSILYTCIGSTIGKIGIAIQELTSNQQINAILPNKSFSSEYLYYYLNLITPRIKASASEQALPLINKTDFEKIEIALPSIKVQNEIADILSAMDSEILALESKLEKYKKIKQGMMQNLLAGKIRLV